MKKYIFGLLILVFSKGFSQEKKYNFEVDQTTIITFRDSIKSVNDLQNYWEEKQKIYKEQTVQKTIQKRIYG